jgi:renalase
MTSSSFAMIGAGMAGLACARRLHASGARVAVFDKARGVGGRMATRRVETTAGPAQFDHGAQYFTARDPAFQDMLATAGEAVAAWPHNLARLIKGKSEPQADEPRFVGAPGMSALAKTLAQTLDVRLAQRVAAIQRAPGGYTLRLEDGAASEAFDAVIVATPAEQAGLLLAPHAPTLAAEADRAVTAPCWAGLFAFAAPTPIPFFALKLADHPVLAWIACDSDKPGRRQDIVCWVAHARPDWTRAHLEAAAEDVAPLLQQALCSFMDNPPAPIFAQAHRWRYAQVERAAPTPFAWDAQARIGVCGDWRIGARVEAAFLSGHQLAGAILA